MTDKPMINIYRISGGWLLVSNVVTSGSSMTQLPVKTSYRGVSRAKQQRDVTHKECHEGAEEALAFHSDKILLQERRRSYISHHHGC